MHLEREVAPCPSEACWRYDGDKDECAIETKCLKVSCHPTGMGISMKTEVFAAHPKSTHVTLERTREFFETEEVDAYSAYCNFGECGMEYSIVNER